MTDTVPEIRMLAQAADTLRQRAERLRARFEDSTPADARSLFYEALAELGTAAEDLRVGEAELRLHAAALSASARRLGAAQDRYAELFEFAAAAYLMTDDEGLILEANAHVATLFNAERAFLRRKPLGVFVSLNSRPAMRRLVRAAAHGRDVVTAPLNLQPRRLPAVAVQAHVGPARRSRGERPVLRWLLVDARAQRTAELEVARLNQAMATPPRPPGQRGLRLSETLERIGGIAIHGRSLVDYAQELTSVIARTAPVRHVGVGLLDQEHILVTAASDPVTAAGDRTQFGAGYGPVVDALMEQRPRCVSGIRSDPRYRRLTAALGRDSADAVLAFPLAVAGTVVGVLSLYREAAFEDSAVADAQVVARSAAISLSAAQALSEADRQVGQLNQALASRTPIDLAKGRLMERYGIGPEAAFDLLRRESQRRHLKLREVAERMAGGIGDRAGLQAGP